MVRHTHLGNSLSTSNLVQAMRPPVYLQPEVQEVFLKKDIPPHVPFYLRSCLVLQSV